MADKGKKFEERHRRNIEQQSKKISAMFDDAAMEAARIGRYGRNSTAPFTFNKALKTDAKKVVRELLRGLDASIKSAVEVGWLLSDQKNDELVRSSLNNAPELIRSFLGHNASALAAFNARKIDGLTFSDRVWRLEDKVMKELESAIDVSLEKGKSAEQLGREVRQYLKDPEKLFRRVRDTRGVLQLSKSAKLFKPGQGVYRSSRANALRLARTEINMSYRTADNIRWEELDFILGYEVKRSNNPYPCPICEALKGIYPKEFNFIGWHPNCRCYTVPVLTDIEDFIEAELMRISGKEVAKPVNNIQMPVSFTDYIQRNLTALYRSTDNGTEPYFLRLNKEYLSKIGVY